MSKQSIKIIFIIVISVVMFTIVKNLFSNQSSEGLKTIITNNAFLVDVRTPQEFAEGHVQGSVNIPLDQVANQLEKFKNHDNIIVFCRSGNRSGQALQILKENGFSNVVNGGTWENVESILNETKQ